MNAKKIILIVIAAVILCIIGAAAFMKIETVTVTGNETNTSEDVEARIFDAEKYSRHTVYQFINQLLGNKVEIPFVEDYKIIFNSPRDTEVIVYEKSIVGYVKYMNNYMYFDKDGIVVDSSPEKIPGVPEITGLDFGSIVLYRELPVEDHRVFDRILNLTQALQNHNISAERIHFSELGEATLYLGDITVELGSTGDMGAKVAELSDMLPQIRERMASEGIKGGTLYLDSYDENSTGTTYTFKKD